MLAKLKAYGVSYNSVKLLDSFTDRQHRVKLGTAVSERETVFRGCLLRSASRPLLWNIYQNDLTYDIDVKFNVYADDHQFYSMRSDMEIVNANLTCSLNLLKRSILLTCLKKIWISIESCCLVASQATILI